MSHEVKLEERSGNKVEGLDAGGEIKKLDKHSLVEKLRELERILYDKSCEKDSFHKLGMEVDGEERTKFFALAAACTREITACRKSINRITRRLRAM